RSPPFSSREEGDAPSSHLAGGSLVLCTMVSEPDAQQGQDGEGQAVGVKRETLASASRATACRRLDADQGEILAAVEQLVEMVAQAVDGVRQRPLLGRQPRELDLGQPLGGRERTQVETLDGIEAGEVVE